jgi:hypothetical protein
MDGSNIGIDKLKCIHKLWAELGRTRSHTPEYETNMNRIRALSAEYQAVVDGSNKPEKSRGFTTPILNAHPD